MHFPRAEFTRAEMNQAARQADLAIFTVGHTSLEGNEMPPKDVLMLIQALTMPTKLHAVSAALSPHLASRCVIPVDLMPCPWDS
jgi:hypothetical protein